MTNLALIDKQRGMSMTNLLSWSIVIIFGAILLMKVVPTYVENRTIVSLLNKVAHDPDLQGGPADEMRNSFDKGLTMNSISTVSANKLEIIPVPGGVVLRMKYDVKISLFSNVSLLMEFDSRSTPPK